MALTIATLTGGVSFAQQRAFTTSDVYSANLGGLAGADATCQAVAASAGLASEGQRFVAWLSDESNDAACRVQGLAGKVSSNCGGAELPGAGPWARVGEPFAWATSLDELTAYGPTLPLNKNEFGEIIPLDEGTLINVHSATSLEGTFRTDQSSCAGWTSSSDVLFVTVGGNDFVSEQWSSAYVDSCAPARRLNCLEVGSGPAIAAIAWQAAGIAFVSESLSNGDLGGLAGADAICRTEAAAAHLPSPNQFVAYLSTDAADAASRLAPGLAFRRPDGYLVAANADDLIDGRLGAPISIFADSRRLADTAGELLLTETQVWTGAYADGSSTGQHCNDWTTNAGSGSAGESWSSTPGWAADIDSTCNADLRFYCFLNRAVLQWDGFESGELDRWSAAVAN